MTNKHTIFCFTHTCIIHPCTSLNYKMGWTVQDSFFLINYHFRKYHKSYNKWNLKQTLHSVNTLIFQEYKCSVSMILISLDKLRYKKSKVFYVNLKPAPQDTLTMVSLLDNIIESMIHFLGLLIK